MTRHLVFSDDGISIAHNAYHRLLAAQYFPESLRDQHQGLAIAAIEQEEFNRVGQEHYRPSEIMQTVSHLAEKRAAQLYLTGFVALSLIWLKLDGQTPSLNRASLIASCAAYTFGKVTWRPGLDPAGPERHSPVTGDPASIERVFRSYRSVAHICAASVAASEYLEPAHLWDQSPSVVASMITTCAAIQDTLEYCIDTTRWNIWDVKKHFPASLGDWPPLLPGENPLAWIEVGHRIAIEEGLIKRR